jgi:hypothetical protein
MCRGAGAGSVILSRERNTGGEQLRAPWMAINSKASQPWPPFNLGVSIMEAAVLKSPVLCVAAEVLRMRGLLETNPFAPAHAAAEALVLQASENCADWHTPAISEGLDHRRHFVLCLTPAPGDQAPS